MGLNLNVMTPKEKAISLYQSFYPQVQWKMGQEDCKDRAKECSLIAVDEIIKNLVDLSNGEFTFIFNVQYWQEVKQEINKL